jgi:rare lipoprotein A
MAGAVPADAVGVRGWVAAGAVCVLLGCSGADGAEPAAAGRAPATGDEAPLEVLRGRASYYADSLAGNPTASGERYDPAALTAASRDLPFGTRVRVIREDTGASVVVRVNDRGPFGDRSRILDLSRAAAERLDMIRAGVVDVRVEVLERPDR